MSYLSCWSMPNRRLVYNSVGASPGFGYDNIQSAVSAKQNPCAVLSGLYFPPHPTWGFGCFAAFTPGCSITHFQRWEALY